MTLAYHIWHVSVSPWYNVSRTFMILTFDLNIKIIFSPWIWVWQNVFALCHRHTKFWHMGVSPWDNMLCTFLFKIEPQQMHPMLTVPHPQILEFQNLAHKCCYMIILHVPCRSIFQFSMLLLSRLAFLVFLVCELAPIHVVK